MKKTMATAGVVGLAALAFQTADAAVLTGTISKTANTCPAAISALNGDDCSYNDSHTQPGTDPWVGPDRSSGFYSSSLALNPTTDWTREPSPGDGKVSPNVIANITIGAGNVVSGTIVIGPVAFNNFSAGPAGRGEDGWTSATITLAPKAADSLIGTHTLIIGSAGFPPYIQASNASDQFPSETAADSNASPAPDVLWWATPAPAIGITNVEGNTGTTGTMGVSDFVGYSCNDVNGNPADGACGGASSFQDRGNFENILLKIRRDTAGNPIGVEGFLVQGGAGAQNPATTPNWVAWTFSATVDTDGDGILDINDNCTLTDNNGTTTANPPQTCDANQEGFGNICDADINNTGLTTSGDYTLLRNALNTANAAADLNCSGLVTSSDYTILRNRLNTAPGPSGLTCASTPPNPPCP
jgi:hypothetical protein